MAITKIVPGISCNARSSVLENPRKLQPEARANLPEGAKYSPMPEKATGTNNIRIIVERMPFILIRNK